MRLLVTDAAAQPPRQATAWLIMTLGKTEPHNMKLKGKTVSVVCQGEEESQTLHNVDIRKIGGSPFLVGTIPKGQTTNDWLAGATGMAPLDKIVDIVIFESEDDYARRQKILKQKKRK